MRHWHYEFEMCEIKYHVKLPKFIASQWIRHRTSKMYNTKAKEINIDKEFYIPRPSSSI